MNSTIAVSTVLCILTSWEVAAGTHSRVSRGQSSGAERRHFPLIRSGAPAAQLPDQPCKECRLHHNEQREYEADGHTHDRPSSYAAHEHLLFSVCHFTPPKDTPSYTTLRRTRSRNCRSPKMDSSAISPGRSSGALRHWVGLVLPALPPVAEIKHDRPKAHPCAWSAVKDFNDKYQQDERDATKYYRSSAERISIFGKPLLLNLLEPPRERHHQPDENQRERQGDRSSELGADRKPEPVDQPIVQTATQDDEHQA